MKDLIRLSDLTMEKVEQIFNIADGILRGEYKNFLKNRTIVLFFPESSIRTRVSFEKGIYLLGGQSILFSPDTLDKKEDIRDVVGYLNLWSDALIVRYREIEKIELIAQTAQCPVINAMTNINHPCEMLADLYSLSKIRSDYREINYLFIGSNGNIGGAWKEAAKLFGFSLTHCSPEQYKIDGIDHINQLSEAVKNKDIICTDSVSSEKQGDFTNYQVTLDIMKRANKGALLNPCPPFYRGQEVSEDVINSPYFVGYQFKSSLLVIQQAILVYYLSMV